MLQHLVSLAKKSALSLSLSLLVPNPSAPLLGGRRSAPPPLPSSSSFSSSMVVADRLVSTTDLRSSCSRMHPLPVLLGGVFGSEDAFKVLYALIYLDYGSAFCAGGLFTPIFLSYVWFALLPEALSWWLRIRNGGSAALLWSVRRRRRQLGFSFRVVKVETVYVGFACVPFLFCNLLGLRLGLLSRLFNLQTLVMFLHI
ncbi:unnamed protein product [Prunus brigantina]